MSTTTIRIPDDLKARVARLAEASGVSAHSFIVEAVAEHVSAAEARADFERLAQERWQHYQSTGLSVSIDDMLRYARDLAAGKNVAAPKARKLDAVPK